MFVIFKVLLFRQSRCKQRIFIVFFQGHRRYSGLVPFILTLTNDFDATGKPSLNQIINEANSIFDNGITHHHVFVGANQCPAISPTRCFGNSNCIRLWRRYLDRTEGGRHGYQIELAQRRGVLSPVFSRWQPNCIFRKLRWQYGHLRFAQYRGGTRAGNPPWHVRPHAGLVSGWQKLVVRLQHGKWQATIFAVLPSECCRRITGKITCFDG